jgi:hypothetical protein
MMCLYNAKVPIMNNRLHTTLNSALKADVGNLCIVEHNGYFTNVEFNENMVKYDHQYESNQQTSPLFAKYLLSVKNIIKKTGLRSTMEIGCGNGYFVDILNKHDIDAFGCDPSYKGNSNKILQQKFNRESLITTDLIILRHVLEHIKDPLIFLNSIKDSVSNLDASIYIEVPSLDWIINNNAFYDFTYEHVNYFDIESLSGFFSSIGESGYLFGGQYIYVIAKVSSLIDSFKDRVSCRNIDKKSESLRTIGNNLNLAINKINELDAPIYLWGAAGKGVIFNTLIESNHSLKKKLFGVIDINQNKIGKYIPKTGKKIFSSDEIYNANVIVMNDNYIQEVKAIVNPTIRVFSISDFI